MTGLFQPAATWALVPLKSPDQAKSRLAGVLSPTQRASLFFALAEGVLSALHATAEIGNVAVVTASPVVAAFSRTLHAIPIVQAADAGMSVALAAGLRELAILKPERVLMVPGDLPLISPAALSAFFSAAGRSPGMAIVPDRRHAGTNLLLCAPPHAVAPCFGERSFERHLAAAATAGVSAHVIHLEALALDLDEPQDLEYLQSRHSARAAELCAAQPSALAPERREAWRRTAVAS